MMNDIEQNKDLPATNVEKSSLKPTRTKSEDDLALGSTTEDAATPQQDKDISNMLSGLSLDRSSYQDKSTENVLICDAGYGFPSESRPRREKILAVAKQLYNFLQWQAEEKDQNKGKYATIKIVVKSEKDKDSLESRLIELWKKTLPNHVEFCFDFPEKCEAVYLSPDAPKALVPSGAPPAVVIVGMLIDRRIQPNRSKNRANVLGTSCARWPLEAIEKRSNIPIDKHEPLNVDVILEGMQQWWWNEESMPKIENRDNEWTFVHAAGQALKRHYERHPNRPLHKTHRS